MDRGAPHRRSGAGARAERSAVKNSGAATLRGQRAGPEQDERGRRRGGAALQEQHRPVHAAVVHGEAVETRNAEVGTRRWLISVPTSAFPTSALVFAGRVRSLEKDENQPVATARIPGSGGNAQRVDLDATRLHRLERDERAGIDGPGPVDVDIRIGAARYAVLAAQLHEGAATERRPTGDLHLRHGASDRVQDGQARVGRQPFPGDDHAPGRGRRQRPAAGLGGPIEGSRRRAAQDVHRDGDGGQQEGERMGHGEPRRAPVPR